MSRDIPITYYLNWRVVSDELIPLIMEQVASYGIKNIVLTESIIYRSNELDTHEIFLKSARSAGLVFVDSHAPLLETDLLGLAPERNRKAMLRSAGNTIRLAAEFGCSTCTFHCWNWRPDTHCAEERFGFICDSLEKLLPVAEENGVIIALENVWSPPCTADMLVRIMKHFNSPWLGLCYDSGHAFLFDYGRKYPGKSCVPVSWTCPEAEIPWDNQTLEKMLPWLVNCHLHDNNGLTDQHVLPGAGLIDWKHIVNLLKQAPNLKCMQSEVIAKWQDGDVKTLKENFEKIFTGESGVVSDS